MHRYEKYLFDYECERHHFATMADLRSAIDANKREGRRNPPTSSGNDFASGGGSARATPLPLHMHNICGTTGSVSSAVLFQDLIDDKGFLGILKPV